MKAAMKGKRASNSSSNSISNMNQQRTATFGQRNNMKQHLLLQRCRRRVVAELLLSALAKVVRNGGVPRLFAWPS
jgi:hypothetical protein